MADRRSWTHSETRDFIMIATELKLVSGTDSKKARNDVMYRSIVKKMEEKGHQFNM